MKTIVITSISVWTVEKGESVKETAKAGCPFG
jgi:hypothetical protein